MKPHKNNASTLLSEEMSASLNDSRKDDGIRVGSNVGCSVGVHKEGMMVGICEGLLVRN